jgi:hypothetical protein
VAATPSNSVIVLTDTPMSDRMTAPVSQTACTIFGASKMAFSQDLVGKSAVVRTAIFESYLLGRRPFWAAFQAE